MSVEYSKLKESLISGWNTWNVNSMLSHVLMPEGLAINLGIKEHAGADFLREALVGRLGGEQCEQRVDNSPEKIYTGGHAYDGSYTELRLEWRGIELTIESATEDDDVFLLIRPIRQQKRAATLIVDPGLLWNREGSLHRQDNESILATLPKRDVMIRTTGTVVDEPSVPLKAPYLAISLANDLAVYTGAPKTLEEIEAIVDGSRSRYHAKKQHYGEQAEIYHAMQSVLAWHVIYDPKKDRVLTQVSRIWSSEWGGWVQHCWDMYFLANMLAVDEKELAYCSAIEITQEKTAEGFVPNCAAANGFATLDRSQPPVGSLIVHNIYKKYQELWFIEYLFDDLLGWNSWYVENRSVAEGVIGLGSKPYEPQLGNHWESAGVGDFYGAAMESGLDNSPMYDGLEMDEQTYCLRLADVGQTSLVLADTQALREIAMALDKTDIIPELDRRIETISRGLQSLWDEEKGLFYNRHTDTGEFSRRISPTNFYPLLTSDIDKEQAARMVEEHLLNPDEFWGEWVIPSISRDDPAYPEQDYWRGRVWPLTNYLVYLGLDKYGVSDAKKALAEKSGQLLMKEWRSDGHLHENYNAETGEGCDVKNSGRYFSWGPLLSLMVLMENGYF
jgi:Mannosylglycerate hydrolase MGH1-like glycoside hydrolase domain